MHYPAPRCLAVLGGALLAGAAAGNEGEIAQHLRAGWIVVTKTEAIENQPGLPPYETLQRRVAITLYELAKDGRRLRCRIEYDSQRDHIEESCG